MKLLDTVALIENMPSLNLYRGQVGTIVEEKVNLNRKYRTSVHKRRLFMKINLRFILTTLIVLLICGTPLVASAQLFDGEREGLLLGVGVGLAALASGGNYEGAASGFVVSGKIGYGMSDQLSLFLSSAVPQFSPHLGFMYFTDRNADYYLQGLIGFADSEEDRHLSISGGVGYELRDQMFLELMLGYTRFSYSYTTGINFWTGEVINETSVTNVITIAATFNVHFY